MNNEGEIRKTDIYFRKFSIRLKYIYIYIFFKWQFCGIRHQSLSADMQNVIPPQIT